MLRTFSLKNIVFALVVALVTTLAVVNATQASGQSTVRSRLTIIAPASPGGGWDGFARETQRTLRSNGIVNSVQVANVPGAGGTIGLGQLVQMQGRSDVLMVSGGVMVGAIAVGKTPDTLADVTPIARLADDYAALVVPADSEIATFEQFIEQWRTNPGGISLAGGSLGSIDHLVTGMLAREIGLDPAEANYIAYSGGGEVLGAMLSHTTTGGLSGYNEFKDQIEAGQLRLLAVSAPERIDGVDAPTFIEGGVNLSMSNWRGLVAPPGLPEEDVAELSAIVDEMHATGEWAEIVERNSWTDSYLVGAEFEAFLEEQQAEVDDVVKELGL